jgi:hypothetical protein
MKIDMSPHAVTLRLKQVNQLRHTCLALADYSAARIIRIKYAANKVVRRTGDHMVTTDRQSSHLDLSGKWEFNPDRAALQFPALWR